MSVILFFFLCMCVCLSVYLSVWLASPCLWAFVCMHMSVSESVSRYVFTSVQLLTFLSCHYLHASLYVCVFIYVRYCLSVPVCLNTCLSLCLSGCLLGYVSVCLFILHAYV